MTSSPLNIVGIIPARGGSKGIPRKNIIDVAGKPLIAHTIDAARASKALSHIVVNTEDSEIREIAERFGATTMGRPEAFFHDNTTQEVDRLLAWSITELEKTLGRIDVVVLLYATSPLRRPEHITQVVERVASEGFDSALTLAPDSSYLWRVDDDGTCKPTNYVPSQRGPRQKENWNQWKENKAVYAFKRDMLMTTGCRLGGKIGYVAMTPLQSVDVDTPDDLELVRAILGSRPRTS